MNAEEMQKIRETFESFD